MATAVTVRADFSTDELRRLAAASKHANQSRRREKRSRRLPTVRQVFVSPAQPRSSVSSRRPHNGHSPLAKILGIRSRHPCWRCRTERELPSTSTARAPHAQLGRDGGAGAERSNQGARAAAILFNHLVGAGEKRWRHYDAERVRGLEVDDQLVIGGLFKGKVLRSRAREDLGR